MKRDCWLMFLLLCPMFSTAEPDRHPARLTQEKADARREVLRAKLGNRYETVMSAIRRSPYMEITVFDPRRMIQVVNVLQPLGPETAAEALRVAWYCRVADYEPIQAILPILWRRRRGALPHGMGLGFPQMEIPGDSADWPDAPFVIVDDVPFSFLHGFAVVGDIIPDPVSDIDEHVSEDEFRSAPLEPASPLFALEDFESRPGGSFLSEGGWDLDQLELQVACALSHLSPAYKRLKGEFADDARRSTPERYWREARDQLFHLGPTWDPEVQDFVSNPFPPQPLAAPILICSLLFIPSGWFGWQAFRCRRGQRMRSNEPSAAATQVGLGEASTSE